MKRILTGFIAMVMILALALPLASCKTAVEAKDTVYYTLPAISAKAGKKVNLREYKVEFSMGVAADNNKINWTSEEIKIDDNEVKPAKAGVYTLVAEYEGYTKNVYLVVNEKGSDANVLYNEAFEADEIPEDITIPQMSNGNVIMDDGGMLILGAGNANSAVKVYLPAYLSEFGDYRLEMNVKIDRICEKGGSVALIARVDDVYGVNYKTEIKTNASDEKGVRLEYNTSGNPAKVLDEGPYTQDLTAGTTYNFALEVNGYTQTLYIDGNKVVESTECSDYAKGILGFKMCGIDANVQDAKVTLNFDEPAEFRKGPYLVRNIKSNLILPPSMLFEVETSDELKGILKNSPAVAVMTVNKNSEVVAKDGSVIDTVPNAIDELGGAVIPAFRVNDEESAVALAAALEPLNISDVMVISDKAELIVKVREGFIYAKGILDFSGRTDLTKDDYADIRFETNKSQSRICLLPAYLCTEEAVDFLTGLATTVWVKAEENTKIENYSLIISGATAIMTKDRKLTESCIADDELFLTNSVVRPVHTVGHRGFPSKSQENTVEGSVLAAENGARVVENDLYLTKDNIIIAMHDHVLDTTTNGSGVVSSMTYEEISQYMVTANSKADPLPIPRLEDYFIEFKDKNVNMFLEIKTGDLRIVPLMRELIEKYDIMDQCCVITFNQSQMLEVRRLIPEISVGYLTSKNSIDLGSIMSITSEFDTTYNPAYMPVNADIVRFAAYRGITIWPWTVNGEGAFSKFYLMGLPGITTDNAALTKGVTKYLTADSTSYTMAVGDFAEPDFKLVSYIDKATTGWDVEMVILEGDKCATFDGLCLEGIKKGSATVVFRSEDFLPDGTSVYFYTQPIEITVE